MEKFFTGNKDTDLNILSNLNDKDLLSLCSVNIYGKNLCQNEDFWANRFRKNFGDTIAKYKPKNVTWKNIYLKAIRELNMDASNLKNLDGLIIVWEDSLISKKFIQYCEKIKGTKNHILIVNSGIRSKLFPAGIAWENCDICKESLYEFVEDLPKNFKYGGNKPNKICLVSEMENFKDKLDGNSFHILINSPLVKGKCGHTYHNGCIDYWRKKKDVCPLDDQFWEPKLMDSYISAHFEKTSDIEERDETALSQIYEKKKKEFEIEFPNMNYDSFFFFKYKLNPNSTESLAMKNEYEDRKSSYINSFHRRFPNSPSNPQYPPFNLFDYSEDKFPKTY